MRRRFTVDASDCRWRLADGPSACRQRLASRSIGHGLDDLLGVRGREVRRDDRRRDWFYPAFAGHRSRLTLEAMHLGQVRG